MSSTDANINYDGNGLLGHQNSTDRPMLSQSSSQSTHGSAMSSDYSSPMVLPQGQHLYRMQDATIAAAMLSSVSSQNLPQNPEWWPPLTTMMPIVNTSINMMEEFGLPQSTGAAHSPITQTDDTRGGASVAGNQEIAEWQEKVRIEVSFSSAILRPC